MRRYSLLCLLLAACAPDIPQNAPARVVTAQYDPLATPPVLPLPNDLAISPTTGLLAIPDAPTDSPAQLEFNAYLRTLDGFPPSTPATTTFSAAIDPATATPSTVATPGAIAVFDVTNLTVLGPKDFAPSVSGDGKTLTLASAKPWALGHQYAVLVYGGDDPHGLKPKDAADGKVVADLFTFFLRSAKPLLTECSDQQLAADDTGACLCPTDPATGKFAAACHPALGMTRAQAEQLEPGRRAFSGLYDNLLSKAVGGDRSLDDLVLFWTFTIAHGPFAEFDPTTGRIPFPNDVLIDQKTGKVNLPIDPNAPAQQKALMMGLNQLDGFSTTAATTAPIVTADGLPPVGAAPGRGVQFLNTTHLSGQPSYAVAPEMVNGGKDYDGLLVVTPLRPLLPDGDEYLALLTNDITDSQGRPLKPSPVMQFVKSQSPLFDPMTMHSTVAQLSDDQAQQLEVLRSAYAQMGLWQLLSAILHISRDQVAMVWTYRTQSMTTALHDAAALPGTRMTATDVTLLDAEPGAALGPDVGQIVWGRMHTHVALGPDGTLDLSKTGGADVDIPFLMTTPKLVPVNGAPVVIVQHGLTGWRGHALAIAEAFASRGWAVIAIDINFHGGRTICTANTDCTNGGTCSAGKCSTSLVVKCSDDSQCAMGGTCNKNSGQCSTSLAPSSSLCMTHLENAQPVTECNPAASGSAFLNFGNPFALRDNFRQHVVDLAQLQRVIEDVGPSGLKAKLSSLAQPVTIDASRTAYIGQSLGGIEGALFLAASDHPKVGVLNVPGGRLTDIILTSPTFMPLLAPLLKANNVAADTPEFYQLLNTFRWITDPGDPINFGRHVLDGQKKVIVQEAGADMVIPNPLTDALTVEIGLPLPGGHPGVVATRIDQMQQGPQPVSTYFPGAAHGFLFAPGVGTASGQAQAVTWIDSDGNYITSP